MTHVVEYQVERELKKIMGLSENATIGVLVFTICKSTLRTVSNFDFIVEVSFKEYWVFCNAACYTMVSDNVRNGPHHNCTLQPQTLESKAQDIN